MASIRFTDVQARLTEFLDLTSLTSRSFSSWCRPFEAAFHAHMAVQRLKGNSNRSPGLPSMRTAPCRPPRIGSCLSLQRRLTFPCICLHA